MIVEKLKCDKKRYLALLLLGDEQEYMIDRYIERGDMFVGIVDDHVAVVCVVIREAEFLAEIKNIAVAPEYRRMGYGRAMLRYVENLYPDCTVQVGTGESPFTLDFYKSCGYSFSHRIPDFFTDNYDHPVIDGGIVLRDMVYMKKTPGWKPTSFS